jgi:hypothetical protein
VVAGLINGSSSTGLFRWSEGSMAQGSIAIFPGTVALRPQMSDSGEAVIRDNLGRLTTFKTIFVRVVADGSNGFASDTGNRPGISTDSTAIAFSGNRTVQESPFMRLSLLLKVLRSLSRWLADRWWNPREGLSPILPANNE